LLTTVYSSIYLTIYITFPDPEFDAGIELILDYFSLLVSGFFLI